MRKVLIIGAGCLSLLLLSVAVSAQQIAGDYIETRNADVWTGACVANGELNLAGDQAILAWHVSKGAWNGVNLDGLSVVGVVKAAATLGDQYNNPYPAQAVMIVDAQASTPQQKALVEMAQALAGGELLKNVVAVHSEPIEMTMAMNQSTRHGGHSAQASLRAGTIVGVETRSLGSDDHLCGNENVYYSPLVSLDHSMPAVAELDEYDGPGLGVIWTLHGKRSAFVGRFVR